VLLSHVKSVTVTRMDLTRDSFDNPYFGWGIDQIRALSPDFGDVIGRVVWHR